MVFFLAGLIQVGLGLVGVGKYIKYIPYPVVSGFMTAIGVIILLTQILPSLGYSPKEDMEYVNQFKPQRKKSYLENILKEEAGEGFLFWKISKKLSGELAILLRQISYESLKLLRQNTLRVQLVQ